MAYNKRKQNDRIYFKPQNNIEYKSTKGVFSCYNFETKETTEFSTFTFISIDNLYRYENDDFTSNLFADLFTDKIHLFNKTGYKYSGTYRFDADSRSLVDEKTGQATDIKGKTNMQCIGMIVFPVTAANETCILSLNGIVKMDLTRKNEDGSNQKKIKTFRDSTIIRLTPQTELVKVGSAKTSKKIYLLDVESLDEDELLEESLLNQMSQIMNVLEQELEGHQREVVKESSPEPAQNRKGLIPTRNNTPASDPYPDLDYIDDDEMPF